MQSETRNGLNILHIAWMHNNRSFCQALVNMNKELNLPLGKADLRGWNIAHFAAKVGSKDVFYYLMNEDFTSQNNISRKDQFTYML